MSKAILELPERLWVGRKRAGMKPREVAAALGMGEHGYRSIKKWEAGAGSPSTPRLDAVAHLYEERGGVSHVWVMTGVGPIMKADPDDLTGAVDLLPGGDE